MTLLTHKVDQVLLLIWLQVPQGCWKILASHQIYKDVAEGHVTRKFFHKTLEGGRSIADSLQSAVKSHKMLECGRSIVDVKLHLLLGKICDLTSQIFVTWCSILGSVVLALYKVLAFLHFDNSSGFSSCHAISIESKAHFFLEKFLALSCNLEILSSIHLVANL